MKKYFDVAIALEGVTDLHKKFSCYYQGVGMLVHPEYRGLGIAKEFLRLRYV